MNAIAWALFGAALGVIAGAIIQWFIMCDDFNEGFNAGAQDECGECEEFDRREAAALAPLPGPDGFTEPPQEWDDASLAALHDDTPGVYRFTPHAAPPPPEAERIARPADNHRGHLGPELAAQLALLDAREAVELGAAARLRADLTDSIPKVET